jgi:carbonic anhydrase/acetyltransferase-like protein (isoleucine patch superfamily)
MGAILLNGVRVGTESIVAAGSLVPEGFEVPPQSMVMGSPAKVRRSLSADEVDAIRGYADRYVENRLDYT